MNDQAPQQDSSSSAAIQHNCEQKSWIFIFYMKIQVSLNTARNKHRKMTWLVNEFCILSLKLNITTQAQKPHSFTVFQIKAIPYSRVSLHIISPYGWYLYHFREITIKIKVKFKTYFICIKSVIIKNSPHGLKIKLHSRPVTEIYSFFNTLPHTWCRCTWVQKLLCLMPVLCNLSLSHEEIL